MDCVDPPGVLVVAVVGVEVAPTIPVVRYGEPVEVVVLSFVLLWAVVVVVPFIVE